MVSGRFVWVLALPYLALSAGCGSNGPGPSSSGSGGASVVLGSGGSVAKPIGAPTFAGTDGIQYNGALRWERRL